MVQAKMIQQIAFLIMMYGTGYVASIRNGASSLISGIQDNYASSSNPSDAMTSNFFPSQPMTTMSELLQSAARQNEYNFRPSQLLEFTPSDATTATTQNYPSYIGAKYPQISHPNAHFTFPSQKLQQQQQQSSQLFNSNNYHTNTQSNKLNTELPTQLQSTPILSYRDPYTNENYYHTPSPVASTNRQEFTVHSSMMVHNQHSDDAPTHQRDSPFPSQSYAATPASFGAVYYPQYSHKYVTPQYNQHPNALPPVNFDRELPAVLPAERPTTPPKRISYDSKDYPPASYYQTSNYLPPPQRQEFSSPSSSSLVSNYANNNNNNNNKLGNYLQGEQYPQQQQQQQQTTSNNYNSRPPSYTSTQYPPPPSYPSNVIRPQYQPSRGGPPQIPSYNNYYEYQQGEVPPPSYRPPYRPSSYPQQSSVLPDGLASLASLFTSTQQYAPQFSNLLFGTGGGSGSGVSNNALGSLLGAFAGGNGGVGSGGGGTASRPVNTQLIKALENIARNDDLQCVPKVLCQMIAGQTQRGQLPDFVTSPAITNFLSAFPAASPAIIYGRAALLGISGGVRSCVQTYAQCPKNEDEILYYLNNHRGGFFKFFSEPEPEQQKPSQASSSAADSSSSLFSIFSALTGNPVIAPTTTPRPRPRPTEASDDFSDGIGSFFTNALSNYLGGGVEYQRSIRRRRSLDTDYVDKEKEIDGFHDEEDDEDTQYGDETDDETTDENENSKYGVIEGRILNKEIVALGVKGGKFFPEAEVDEKIRNSFVAFNEEKASRKLKFPSETTSREYNDAKLKTGHRGGKEINFKDMEDFEAIAAHQVNLVDNDQNDDNDSDDNIYKKLSGKMVRFQDDDQSVVNTKYSTIIVQESPEEGNVRFPNNYEEIIRKGRILNRPAYAGGYADYVRYQDDDQDKLIVSDNKRRPHYQSSNFQSTSSSNNYNNAQTYTVNTNRYGNSAHLSNTNSGNYKQPSNDNYPRYEYPNNNYVSNNRYGAGSNNNYYQQSATRATRRPHEDDKNVYVTNGKGTTEYYITPDGRKVYL